MFEYDEKGKVFTDVVRKQPLPALVQTTIHAIRGYIHVRPGERVKDELDRNELFLAMTQAQVLSVEGKVLYEAPFIAVRREQILWVIPLEEEPEHHE
jgi:hypothetical protein